MCKWDTLSVGGCRFLGCFLLPLAGSVQLHFCHWCFQVSTAGQHSKKPSTLLSCSRKFLNLPDQVSAIHIEFTEYYFPDNQDFPGNTPRLAPSFISSFRNQCFHSLGVLSILKLLCMSVVHLVPWCFCMFAFLNYYWENGAGFTWCKMWRKCCTQKIMNPRAYWRTCFG